VGAARYPLFPSFQDAFIPIYNDVTSLSALFRSTKEFDEIIVIRDGDFTLENLQYITQQYITVEAERFNGNVNVFFAISGVGTSRHTILLPTARAIDDDPNAIPMYWLESMLAHVSSVTNTLLVIVNASYSQDFGKTISLASGRNGTAIAAGEIAAGDTAFAVANFGPGSVLFELLKKALRGDQILVGKTIIQPPGRDDGTMDPYELFAYMRYVADRLNLGASFRPTLVQWGDQRADSRGFVLSRGLSLSNNERPNSDAPATDRFWRSIVWLRGMVIAYPIPFVVVASVISWFAAWWGAFRMSPLRFYAASQAVDGLGHMEIGPVKISLPVGWLAMSWLTHHPSVLDAWISKHLPAARASWPKKQTVAERLIHIPLAMIVDGSIKPELKPEVLQDSAFAKGPGVLLISGEGGVGKTSLACQIGSSCLSQQQADWICQHPMIPILIERELATGSLDGQEPLVEAVRAELVTGLGLIRSVAPRFLDALLRHRRLLVIVDHLSEMSEGTRKAMRLSGPDFPIKALVVTSRQVEALGAINVVTVLQPLRVDSDRIIEFMTAYLRELKIVKPFVDRDFIDARDKLLSLVGDRDVTVLLARLFSDQLVESRNAKNTSDTKLPENIPELMLAYINRINKTIGESERRRNLEIQQSAQTVAWVCLQEKLRPIEAKVEAARRALHSDADALLSYLRERLCIIRISGVREDRVRFELDPLAEYLAAIQFAERTGGDEDKWRRFINRATPRAAEARQFLLALRDVIKVDLVNNIPKFSLEAIDDLIGPRGTNSGDRKEPRGRADAFAIDLVWRQIAGDASLRPSEGALYKAIDAASDEARLYIFYQASKNREHNWKERKEVMERSIPILRSLVSIDVSATIHNLRAEFGYALKDKHEPELDKAEELFTQAIKARGVDENGNWAIYEANRALTRIMMKNDFNLRYKSSNEAANLIKEDLRTAVRDEWVGGWLLKDPVVIAWARENNLKLDEFVRTESNSRRTEGAERLVDGA
jgi:hypothetical protein